MLVAIVVVVNIVSRTCVGNLIKRKEQKGEKKKC